MSFYLGQQTPVHFRSALGASSSWQTFSSSCRLPSNCGPAVTGVTCAVTNLGRWPRNACGIQACTAVGCSLFCPFGSEICACIGLQSASRRWLLLLLLCSHLLLVISLNAQYPWSGQPAAAWTLGDSLRFVHITFGLGLWLILDGAASLLYFQHVCREIIKASECETCDFSRKLVHHVLFRS